MTTMAAFIEQAWTDHATDEAGVATRVEAQTAQLAHAPEQIASFLALAQHVLISHRGDAAAMERCLQRVADMRCDEAALGAIAAARLAAALMRDTATPAGGVPVAVAIRAHGNAACGHASRGDAAAARALLQSATALAREDDAPALKALAACHHNLAAQLQEAGSSPATDELMMHAARESRRVWLQAGTWVNVERADYMLSRCAATLGDLEQALAHARSCLAICEANGADAFERFFAHEALARAGDDRSAHLQALRALLAGIDDEGDRAYAQSVLDAL
ncbi:hypothetical protein [Piscinibacter sp. XHJ-5]|uniref:hypothetical protein n=1 Tax=Piscinibacter sp. XHJ-5 TaxID=3037797 RepID=UPI0024532F1D|nr:hypothetical protein [Piscinibacter sp. XHJ-5]